METNRRNEMPESTKGGGTFMIASSTFASVPNLGENG